MRSINRREFIQQSAAMVTAACALPSLASGENAVKAACTRHPLGKTGVMPTLLGMGTGTRAGNKSSEQNRQGREGFLKTLIHAYEQGIRYYDMSDSYGAHEYVRDAIKQANMPRTELVLNTKTDSRDAAKVRADIERFRKELDTDYLDVVMLHCMTSKDWPEKLAPCMDVLSEAKQKGQIRAVGVSCHDKGALQRAAESPWVDVMLGRINPGTVLMDGTPEEIAAILKTAHANGKGVIGMKILGEGKLVNRIDEALKFSVGLGCLDAMAIGFVKPNEIDDTIARIEIASAK